jgi:hypothetical protein
MSVGKGTVLLRHANSPETPLSFHPDSGIPSLRAIKDSASMTARWYRSASPTFCKLPPITRYNIPNDSAMMENATRISSSENPRWRWGLRGLMAQSALG